MQALVYPQAVCNSGDCVACTPDASGVCIVDQGVMTGGTPIMGSATWSRGQDEVVIEF